YTNPFVEKAFYLVCGDKLISDGYCDMDIYISGKINKESMLQMLKNNDSPFIKLYKNGYSKTKKLAETLNDFFESQVMQNYGKTDDMKLIEAQALINWIYKSFPNVDARLEATKELMQLLMEKYQLSGEIHISKGIAYLHSQVELNFVSSTEKYWKCIKGISPLERTIFYRGHAEANYILVPSLMRKQNWLFNERTMYNELLINSPESFEKMNSHLEYLVEMQHYGLPTRLLDITTNPLVALYFACENHHDSYGEIVVFSIGNHNMKYPQSDTVSILASLPMFEYEKQQEIYKYAIDNRLTQEEFNKKVGRLLHEVKTEKPAFKDQIIKEDLLHSLIVLPLKNNNRILKQDGAFILCGLSKDYRHLDVNELRYNDTNGKRQIIIVENKQQILDELNAFSINKATLFPEIDDVADYIKSKY
ncbi:MAG: FRG domain-containing protein, partial [Bacillota bacterium]|nr:FRG domain-containing protein [Bacillota bacterium]